jgi:tetratricopeptide (TPR) repeat protein
LLLLALTTVALPAGAATRAQDHARCIQDDPDTSISGCTVLIRSGHETRAQLADDYYNRGLSYDIKGLIDLAIVDDSRAIGFRPHYAAAYNNRAWAYHGKGEDARGLPDAEKAVAWEPISNNLETRAEIYEKLGRRDAAIADYQAALKLSPAMPEALAGLKRLGVKP